VIWNETINAARLGLRAAIQSVQDWDPAFTDQQALALLLVVADVEGVPPLREGPMTYDLELYNEVRRRLP
jgi:hypothetical protein